MKETELSRSRTNAIDDLLSSSEKRAKEKERPLAGYALAAGAWASTFALAWLMILGIVAMWPPGAFLVFFFLIAAMTSMLLWSPAGKRK